MMAFSFILLLSLLIERMMYMNNKCINDLINQYPILNQVSDVLLLRNDAENTIKDYLYGIARFLKFINYDNEFEITQEHFISYIIALNKTNLSKNTINSYNSYVRFFFEAVLDKPYNQYKVPKAKTEKKEIDYLMDHQILALFNETASDSRDDCIIKLGVCCGLRIDEVASLKVCNIHTKDSKKFIHIDHAKRNKQRNVLLDNTTYCAIQRYAKEYHIKPGTNEYFFQFRKNHKPCTQTIRIHFDKHKEAAGIQSSLTFHSLRHTYAVNFLVSGGDLLDLKYRLGHSSLASTSHYLHFAKNMMKPGISYMDKLLKDVK